MDLDHARLEAISDAAKASGDAERRALAELCLAFERDYDKLRATTVAIAEATRDYVAIASAPAAPGSILAERGASLLALLNGAMLGGGVGEAELKKLHYEGGDFEMVATHWAAAILAQGMANTLTDPKTGKHWNVVELTMSHKELGTMLITVQRKSGKTPMDLLREVRADVTVLREAIGVMVPTIIRSFISICPDDAEVDLAGARATLTRIEAAMVATKERP